MTVVPIKMLVNQSVKVHISVLAIKIYGAAGELNWINMERLYIIILLVKCLKYADWLLNYNIWQTTNITGTLIEIKP